MSSASKSPSTRSTPTGSTLAPPRIRASAAPAFTYKEPLANESLWAIHFLRPDGAASEATNTVQGTDGLPTAARAGIMPSRLPLPNTTSMPSAATRRAMRHFDPIPPRPRLDFAELIKHVGSSAASSRSISCEAGSEGLPVNRPSILLSIISLSAFIIAAISPDSSSLSVNISSVIDTVSFSFTIGTTPWRSMASIQFFWLR